MSEHTENIRRAVKIGFDKLVDALDSMEKERDAAQMRVRELEKRLEDLKEQMKVERNNCSCLGCRLNRELRSENP